VAQPIARDIGALEVLSPWNVERVDALVHDLQRHELLIGDLTNSRDQEIDIAVLVGVADGE